jgi:hypothetical protein
VSTRAEAERRRWELVDAETIRENARFYREHGPGGCMRVAEELYAHAELVGALDADRTEDLRHHVEVRAKLDRVARALARR